MNGLASYAVTSPHIGRKPKAKASILARPALYVGRACLGVFNDMADFLQRSHVSPLLSQAPNRYTPKRRRGRVVEGAPLLRE